MQRRRRLRAPAIRFTAASPARASSRLVERESYAAGYPLHGGLAGPSQLATRERESYAAGYPLHGGLAGPSRVEEGR